MRWKIKNNKVGDIIQISFFAVFPYRIGDEIRWWEKVTITQQYISGGIGNYWKDIKFID